MTGTFRIDVEICGQTKDAIKLRPCIEHDMSSEWVRRSEVQIEPVLGDDNARAAGPGRDIVFFPHPPRHDGDGRRRQDRVGPSACTPAQNDWSLAPGAVRMTTDTDRDVLRQDLSELMALAGMDDFARPQSPHDVFQEALAKIRAKLDAKPTTAFLPYRGPVSVRIHGAGMVTVQRQNGVYAWEADAEAGRVNDCAGSEMLALVAGGMALQRLAKGDTA